jgi:hypothetical protein
MVEVYSLANGTLSRRAERVAELMLTKPFLWGEEVCLSTILPTYHLIRSCF